MAQLGGDVEKIDFAGDAISLANCTLGGSFRSVAPDQNTNKSYQILKKADSTKFTTHLEHFVELSKSR